MSGQDVPALQKPRYVNGEPRAAPLLDETPYETATWGNGAIIYQPQDDSSTPSALDGVCVSSMNQRYTQAELDELCAGRMKWR